jgi:glucose/arabinose dehydrogenase
MQRFPPTLPVALLTTLAAAQTPPSGFVIDTVISGSAVAAPMDFCFLPDGRVLIANRAGSVSVWADPSSATVGTVASVESGGERGLLSITADPNFPTNGYIYVYYSHNSDTFMHLDRFTCTGDLSNPSSTNLTFSTASRRVILAAIPDNAFNHNGGACRFGPDGKLYQTIGDDANMCMAQSTTSSLGCLLRMDVSGLPAGGSTTPQTFSSLDPGDNPLSANSDVSQLVIANGLRNPFRMEIDQLTGNVYIGDVGLSTREEYSEYVYPSAGPMPLRNFGWPFREGATTGPSNSCGTPPSGLIEPLADVGSSSWNAVMGGPRYRNQGGRYDFGAAYEGDAFFLDFFAGEVRRLDHNGTSWPASATVWTNGFGAVSALRQGPDGALWFAANTSTSPSSGGSIKRVRPIGPINSVVAVGGDGQIGPSGETLPMPIVARVLDPQNNPLPGGTVNFSIAGAGTLSTTNPVIADGNGEATTMVTASPTSGGGITVTASTPGSPNNATFSLYSRRLTVTPSGSWLILTIANKTDAVPTNVPYLIMVSFPRTPMLPTYFGPVLNPLEPATLVLEDAFGHFPVVTWANTGGIGTPTLTKVYTLVPPGLFTGQRMTFQAVGLDALTGWFKTNEEVKQL